jgi:hypothetical protein
MLRELARSYLTIVKDLTRVYLLIRSFSRVMGRIVAAM